MCGILSEQLGGTQVDARNVRSNLGSMFGADSSAKAQQVMQLIDMFQSGTSPGGNA